jgi:tetratricopeptide (TPR) repeat protein
LKKTAAVVALLLFFCAAIYPAQGDPRTKEEQLFLYMKQGKKLLESKKYDEALKYFNYVLKMSPKDPEPLKNIAFVYYRMGNHKYAYTVFKKVLELDPNDEDAMEFMDYYTNVIESKKKKNEKREMADSIWRAALLPGWGQIHNNQNVKGIVVGGAFILSAGLAVYNTAAEITMYDKYLNTNQNHDIAFSRAQEAWNMALISTLAAGAVYAFGIIDASLNYDSEEARLGFAPLEGGAGLAFTREW